MFCSKEHFVFDGAAQPFGCVARGAAPEPGLPLIFGGRRAGDVVVVVVVVVCGGGGGGVGRAGARGLF